MHLTASHEPLTADEFQGLASMLRKAETVFESTIAGSSMEPAIPDGAKIRIQPRATHDYRVGNIVACATGNALFAHRIVYCGKSPRTRAYVITKGDGWVLCDSPTPRIAILGEVMAYCQDGVWLQPDKHAAAVAANRVIGAASLWLIRSALFIHLEFARRVAGICLLSGGLCKRWAARWSKATIGA